MPWYIAPSIHSIYTIYVKKLLIGIGKKYNKKRKQTLLNNQELKLHCFGSKLKTLSLFYLVVTSSAAKCHEHHEIFTKENNEHMRGSLMIMADTQ